MSSGISAALAELVETAGPDAPRVDAVMLGTTHFTNAIVERRGLTPTAAIRIGLPATAFLEPFTDWPHRSCRGHPRAALHGSRRP